MTLSTREATSTIDGALETLGRTIHYWFRLRWDHTPLAVDLEDQLDQMGYALVRKSDLTQGC